MHLDALSRAAAIGLGVLLLSSAPAAAQWTSSRPDGHAPIGVMGDHRHEGGEIMLSYRYMRMDMDGSRFGTERITDQSVVASPTFGFLVTPTRMPMSMHMLGAMVAPSDAVTLMAMVPILQQDMDHITRAGGTRENPAFTTSSSGIGDVRVGGLIRLATFGSQSLHLNAGVGIPTGSIDEQDVLPTSAGQPVRLPYPMQVGSGTWDAMPGITYLGQGGDWSWGGQATAIFRLGTNDNDYRLGHRYGATAWGARRLGRHLSLSLRLDGLRVENVEGADPAPSVNPVVVPTARTDLRSGTRLDGGVGINVYLPRAKGLRFAAELLGPLVQDLSGPQLETDWTLILGSQIVIRSH